MNQLYGHKWSSQHALMGGADYSEDFHLWAKKTAHLSDTAWQRGIEAVEYRNQEAARNGKTDSWPPNYAEFIGMCQPAPGSAALKPFKPLALPDGQAKAKAREKGAEELAKMRAELGI